MSRSLTSLKSAFLKMMVAAALLSVAASTRADGPLPNCFGLGIGHTRNNPGSRALDGSVRDAQDIYKEFQKQQGILFGTVDWMFRTEKEATAAGIGDGVNRLVAKCKGGDTVVVSLCLHGNRTGNNEWYCVAYDGQTISGRALVEKLAPLTRRGVKVILIIDSCHSGALQETLYPYLNSGTGEGGFIVFLSSLPEKNSMGGGPHTVFTQAWLDGMGGAADLNGDGRITLAELKLYVRERTKQIIRNQLPAVEIPGMIWKFEQYTDCVHSLSIPDSMPLASTGRPGLPREIRKLGIQGVTLIPQTETKDPLAGKSRGFKGIWKMNVGGKEAGKFVFFAPARAALLQPARAAEYVVIFGGVVTKGIYGTRGNELILMSEDFQEPQFLQVTWLNEDKFQLTLKGVQYTFEREKESL